MGIIGDALLGGIAGGAGAASDAAKLSLQEYNAENHERLKQQLIGEREARNAQLASGLRTQEALTSPRVIAPGSTLRTPGEPDFTAPDTKHPQQVLDYYAAQAARMNAEAAAIRDGLKYRNKDAKPTLPKFDVIKDEVGNPYAFVDSNSGAVGTIVQGAPAQEGKTHWFSPDEPAMPAQPSRIVWQLNGKPLLNGLADVYPDIAARSAGVASPASGRPAVVDPFQKPNAGSFWNTGERPPLSSFFGGGPKPAGNPAGYMAPAPAATRTASTPAADSSPAGKALDAARTHLANAQANWSSWGTLKRKRDPEGFMAAQSDLEAAQKEVDDAQAEWELQIGYGRATRTIPLRTH